MGTWDATTFDGKPTILRVVRTEAERMFALAEAPQAWEAPTACPNWQVRDVIAHLVDTTESYFTAFDIARGNGTAEPAYGLPGMAERANSQAQEFRKVPQPELMERVRTDFEKMADMLTALGPADWEGLMVPHYYMGPLPAYFFAAGQLMDYGVHTWDIEEGTGRPHALSGEAADLLVPFMFVLWKYTVAADRAAAASADPIQVGIRITSGNNAGDTRITVNADGLNYEPGDVGDLPAVLEFDPGSFVLAAFGRCNTGSVRGDRTVADRFLNLFFRI